VTTLPAIEIAARDAATKEEILTKASRDLIKARAAYKKVRSGLRAGTLVAAERAHEAAAEACQAANIKYAKLVEAQERATRRAEKAAKAAAKPTQTSFSL
jgi:hypothetical protein